MSQQQGSRYERSMSGMVGAMLVTIVLVLIFVVIRAITRDDVELERESIEYLPVVAAVQEADKLDPAYPPSLPSGWKAIGAGVRGNGWEMDFETAAGNHISIRQQTRVLQDMVREYVDEDASDDGIVRVGGEYGDEWRAFSDGQGDQAVAVMLEDNEVLLVFGTAPADELRVFASSLVDDPAE